MLFLDGTHLLGKYGGILLGATAKDGNEGLFHLAFAIVDNETDDNWTWFISTLGDAIYGEDDYHKIITFISDRSKGLVNAIAKVFPSAPHGYCLRHLQANFLKANGLLGKGLKDECWRLVVKIAYACTSSKYDATVGAFSAISTQAHNWLFQKSDMMHWCNYLFRGQRWGEMYSNVAESFNAWIKEARHLPVCNMVDAIRFKMMNLMYKRRENSMKWEIHLCPEIHKKIEKTIEESRCLVIGRSDGDIFEVVDKQGNHVDLRSRTCSCRRWDVYGLPCNHACCAILQTDVNIHCYMEGYYTVALYKEAYETSSYSSTYLKEETRMTKKKED
ncbi:uncharacterized protein LOC120256291 [Dioscorea cayenensis subsp. rotundata]|uniref:Uncharacterized protein LOC120256291 n=1 Tax=Dioscorea cayennensis subsp. rotundata TaxID=55577 RepID=A0AB40AY70_DIOCR|nr:uncharacterized protein LOC120256291 [Dioscorea cayenensis subsp. rotundata]